MRPNVPALAVAFALLVVSSSACSIDDPGGIDASGGGPVGPVGAPPRQSSIPDLTGPRTPPSIAPTQPVTAGAPSQPPPPVTVDSKTCQKLAEDNGGGLVSPDCAQCLCEFAPGPTAQCSPDCWGLMGCVVRSGCAQADTSCVVNSCLSGEFAQRGAATMDAQSVPIDECRRECLASLAGGGVPGAGVAVPPRRDCTPLRASAKRANVGESIELSWDAAIAPGTFTLAVSPWATVGSLHEVDGRTRFRCDAAGTATITLDNDVCVDGAFGVDVQCVASEAAACCPIGALDDPGERCVDLGGSPPCFRGCDCLREGGVYYTEPDANGCLRWVLRASLQSSEALICLDEAGQPAPDPRGAQ